MTARRTRLLELCELWQVPSHCIEELPDEPERYVMLEHGRHEMWVTTGDDLADLVLYHHTQEYAEDWTEREPSFIDLDAGEKVDAPSAHVVVGAPNQVRVRQIVDALSPPEGFDCPPAHAAATAALRWTLGEISDDEMLTAIEAEVTTDGT